ncbi:LPXTG-site transpeptidase (sortase) family protein [Scopulibacillus darangshiensis]|uniref:LPXTG-site transpeptidase (Sortase) family protein n=1 Tax=Scopulibacillus darangshiensis TaxID=442528 RepID=A0A4R2NZU3_9BACL|nr:class F sortase [Scopulibacillus darangshiensis]TCP27081.1 LPXTG-site transpeptidase (sortase) family protein [Scopulibacillus darangshiensis]
MKKWIIGVVAVLAVIVMYVFYQQPFGGGTQAKETVNNGKHMVKLKQEKPKDLSMINSQYQSALDKASANEDRKFTDQSYQGIVPKKIMIPKIKVEANVEQVGLTKDGKMGVPGGTNNVAWYKKGAKPGGIGNAVIDGHVDSYRGPAIFFHLKDLKKNDKIYIFGKDGRKLTYKVTKIESYPNGEAPLKKIFGPTNKQMLNLITCTGTYQEDLETHDHRLVVYSERVS